MSTPLVSILMTMYNREKFISDAIESVINSTYNNWELIIVDDGSNDRSVEIASKFQLADDRISVYINDKNLGDYPNRNKAAGYAKGKYLKYVDSDDLIYPYGIEILVFYMEKYPEAGYGLCSFPQDFYEMYPIILNPEEAYLKNYFGSGLFHKAPLSSIIKRDAFEDVEGFSGKQHLGDFELWHILSQKFKVLLLPDGIIWSREHSDQQMIDNLTNPLVPYKYLVNAKEHLNSKFCPLDSEHTKKALESLERQQGRSLLSALKRNSLKKALELYRYDSPKISNLLSSIISRK